jgi:ABC transporter substrate binding protein
LDMSTVRTCCWRRDFPGQRSTDLTKWRARLVALNCTVIFASNPYGIRAATKATGTIPIVGVDLESDPVASGLVKSVARPGGNFTGFFLDIPELGGKQIELLVEAVPRVSRVAVLWDAAIGTVQFQATKTAPPPPASRCNPFQSGAWKISIRRSSKRRGSKPRGWLCSRHL